MRWDGLFADLEAQSEALERGERAAEVDERTRIEVGGLGVHERLRAAVGRPLRLRLPGEQSVGGVLERVGADWVLIAEEAAREVLVPLAGVLGVRGLGRFSAVAGSEGLIESRLTLRTALRGIVRDRSAVRVLLVDGSTVDGTLDRVGSDFVELAVHGPGELRRRHDVRETELLTLTAITAVRRVT